MNGELVSCESPAGARPLARGFTLIELLVVMSIVGLLLALASPRYFNSLDRAKDVALSENLKVIRSQVDRFYADRGRYPENLTELVDEKYLREVPVDPMTESAETWIIIAPAEGSAGVMDVRSGARGQTRKGVPYHEL